jgi:hypothetical protein
MLLAAVDFRADHLKRIEKRLDGIVAASTFIVRTSVEEFGGR